MLQLTKPVGIVKPDIKPTINYSGYMFTAKIQ